MSDASNQMNNNNTAQGTATAPQGTATAPQGTATAPQGTATAPQGTAAAPQGTTTPPLDSFASPIDFGTPITKPSFPYASSRPAYSGSQAEILIQDGKVLKVYKRGYGFNAAVLPLVKQMKGKGYLVDLEDYGTMEYQGERRQFELMEYCPEGAVSAIDLKGNKDAILKIAVKTALALDACHRAGFIHKDVKPANILIRDKRNWDCVLCDFGIADILENGKASAVQDRTPIYAAPEVYERTAVIDNRTYCELTPAADYYSLGMTILCLWYGESTFRSKETIMAIHKVHDGIIVPADMPDPLNTITRGLLVKDPAHRWGLKEIEDFLKGKKVPVYDDKAKGNLNIIFNGSKNQVAHTKEELAEFMAGDAPLSKKYLYSGKISSWLESIPELQVEIEKIVEKDFPKQQTMGWLAAIHTMNPFYDLNLCCDIHDSDYAMTGEAIGRLLNKAYYLYYTKYNADYDAMQRGYNDSDRQMVRDAEIVYSIVSSFERNNKNDYLPWFFDHKGKRFEQQRKWFDYCVNPVIDKKKAGPKDKKYLQQLAMMKTIVGFGAKPRYRLSRTGEELTTIDDIYKVSINELKYDLKHNKGFRAWLAVQCHEDPNTDMSQKYTYEKLLEKYLGLIGYIDNDDLNYCRFRQAQQIASSISTDAKDRIINSWTATRLQKVIVWGLAILPLLVVLVEIVLNIINDPFLDFRGFKFRGWFIWMGLIIALIVYFASDTDSGLIGAVAAGMGASFVVFLIIKYVGGIILWLYAAVVIGVIVFFGIKTLFHKSSYQQSASSVMNPGFEELTLEPLHFAFSDESRFDSSMNGVVDTDSINNWKYDLNQQWKWILIFVGSAIVLFSLGFLLPKHI